MRNFTIVDAPQRSEQWFEARLGKLTGSRAADMLATIKSGEAAGRRNLRVQLVLERLTGRSQDKTFVTPAMQDGIEREPEAYRYYEALTGQMLTRTGFLCHVEHAAGCSLDGHVGDFEGIIEIKSPTPAVHLEYLRSGQVPGDYLKQILHGLWISNAQWCDWMSFHPDFPDPLKAKVLRIERKAVDLTAYETAALKFLAEVDTELMAVRTISNLPAVLKEASVA